MHATSPLMFCNFFLHTLVLAIQKLTNGAFYSGKKRSLIRTHQTDLIGYVQKDHVVETTKYRSSRFEFSAHFGGVHGN